MTTQETHIARLATADRGNDDAPWARRNQIALAVLAVAVALTGCSAITWDAGRAAAHVTCRDTESVVALPGGQTLTITHERGRGLCDAVEALHGGRP